MRAPGIEPGRLSTPDSKFGSLGQVRIRKPQEIQLVKPETR
jgi:hypothetical protein